MSFVVRKSRPEDEQAWRRLFAAYNQFYRAQVAEHVMATTWERLGNAQSGMECVVAESEGEVIGFANFLFHPATWSVAPACYLEDLFVDPTYRGSGVARALIDAVEGSACERGAFRLYWHTQEYNAPARSLYDTVASRSSFIVYSKNLPALRQE